MRIVTLMRYATGLAPLDGYELELGRAGTPAAVVDDLEAALTVGIDELTRPVDAIRHQAKTVTVGISRSDQTLLEAPLIRAALATGAPRDNLSYSTIRALADLSPAVAEVVGHTRYRLDGLDQIAVVDQGGVATQITSRTASVPSLTGSKAPGGGRAPGAGRSRPPRRARGRIRPGGGCRRDCGHHAAPRPASRIPFRPPWPGASCRGTAIATRSCATRSPRPSLPSTRTVWPRSR